MRISKNPVPLPELRITFARSSGAGGQHVNKTSTKAIIHWNVGMSASFDEDQKRLIRLKLANRLNDNDDIVVMSEEERSQSQNRDTAIVRINQLVVQSLLIPKKRRATRPTFASKVKRLEFKKKRSYIKKRRRVRNDEDAPV